MKTTTKTTKIRDWLSLSWWWWWFTQESHSRILVLLHTTHNTQCTRFCWKYRYCQRLTRITSMTKKTTFFTTTDKDEVLVYRSSKDCPLEEDSSSLVLTIHSSSVPFFLTEIVSHLSQDKHREEATDSRRKSSRVEGEEFSSRRRRTKMRITDRHWRKNENLLWFMMVCVSRSLCYRLSLSSSHDSTVSSLSQSIEVRQFFRMNNRTVPPGMYTAMKGKG